MFYDDAKLNATQRANADIIVQAVLAVWPDPQHVAFMIALAVTESSLGLRTSGDDGVSVGLFQLNSKFYAGETVATLQDASHNAALAVDLLQSIMKIYPGHTWGDYAEAWTLGAHGRFDLGRRNLRKVMSVQNAITFLNLDLDLNVVVTSA